MIVSGWIGGETVATFYANPLPYGSNDSASVCTGSSINYDPSVNVSSTSGVAATVTFTSTADPGITGNTAGGSGTITDVLTNSNSFAGTVVYTFTPTATSGSCVGTTFTYTVTVDPQPVANAGTGGAKCDLDFALGAVLSTGTGMWSQFSGTGSVSFPDPTDPNAIATSDSYGTFVLQWTEVSGSCSDVAQITVDFYQQSVANAGPDQTIAIGGTAILSGTGGSPSLASWITSGDGSFDDPTSFTPVYSPGPGDEVSGSVTLSLTAVDPGGVCTSSTDNLILTINDPPTVTTADSLALVAIFDATDGPNWSNRLNWKVGKVNTWDRVTVAANRVTGLNLSSNNLTGIIPSDIGLLDGLVDLNLSYNNLSGETL